MKLQRTLSRVGILALAIPVFACSGSDRGERAEGVATKSQPQTELLVSAEWLAERLDDPSVVVLHVAPNRSAYDEGHIPGARFLPLSAIVTEVDGNTNELPPVEHLDSVFESLGVSDDTRVIIYGPPLPAARALFTLEYLGHDGQVAILDGGLEGWKLEGRPLSTDAPEYEPGTFTPRPRPELVVDAAWIEAHLGDPNIVLIDARPADQYTGEVAGEGIGRPGHIPGARNIFWQETIVSADHPALKDRAELEELFRAAEVDAGDTVVTYCRTGMQASWAYFVSRYLGYETRMYDASYMDWSRREELPVAR